MLGKALGEIANLIMVSIGGCHIVTAGPCGQWIFIVTAVRGTGSRSLLVTWTLDPAVLSFGVTQNYLSVSI